MNDRLIEEALRAGPDDEASTPRQLTLPPVALRAVRPVAATVGRDGTGRGRRWTASVALAVIVIVGGVVAAAMISARSSVVPGGRPPHASASSATAGPASASPAAASSFPLELAGGITLQIPTGWAVVAPGADIAGGGLLAAAANFDLPKQCEGQASVRSCVDSLRLGPGDIVLTMANDETAMRIEDIAVPGVPTERIDAMPAVLQIVEAAPGTPISGVLGPRGCDAHRAWWIARPGRATGWLDLEACSSRADRADFHRSVDGVARSTVFP